MDDLGFNGSGSQFLTTRFKSGDPISAKQLNILAAAVQTALPMPYIGEGNQVAYTGGGSLILGNASTTVQNIVEPFTVSVYTVDSEYRFTVTPGTINGLVPCIGGGTGASNLLTAYSPQPYGVLNFDVDGNCWVYLKAGPNPLGAKQWPNNDFTKVTYPNVIGFNAIQTDSDSYGHILVALVNKNPSTSAITISNLLQTSVWSQRNKYTIPDSSIYYFWPI